MCIRDSSGVLLFPVTLEMGAFYSRRLKRVLVPLIVWSLALPLLYFGYFAAGVQTASPNIVMDTYTWSATVGKLYTFFFNFNYDTTPLWYVYMLVGLYLFMPIMSAWLTQARRKDVKIFLGIWIFSMTLPYIQMLAPALGYEGCLLYTSKIPGSRDSGLPYRSPLRQSHPAAGQF